VPPARNRPRDWSTLTRLEIARGLSALGRAALLKVEKRGTRCFKNEAVWSPLGSRASFRWNALKQASARSPVTRFGPP